MGEFQWNTTETTHLFQSLPIAIQRSAIFPLIYDLILSSWIISTVVKHSFN